MADPNTQIDWWIAQTWQEAQGGADADALVAWLHENGLTAVSSYTILQAALSCSPDEAKQMVFGHPAWAGADAEADLSEAEYTSDTLEPEPEPDATFGLDDWADEIEEDEPVYGEPGYQPPPTAAPARPAGSEGEAPAPRNMLLDAYAEMEEEDSAPTGEDDLAGQEDSAAPGEPYADTDSLFQPEAENDPEPGETEPIGAMDPESVTSFELADGEADEDEPEIDADQVFEPEPEWEAEPAAAPEPAVAPEPAPMASMVPSPSPQQKEDSLEQASLAGAGAPPILRMPPATPAERAATFAAAFGKKPSTAQHLSKESDIADGGSPPNEMGPAAQAETAPAHGSAEHPQPAMAAAVMPPPLVLEPMPEIQVPPPVAAAEPLFTTPAAHRHESAPPLFPDKQPDQVVAEPPEPEVETLGEPLPSPPDNVEFPDREDEVEGHVLDAMSAPEPDVVLEDPGYAMDQQAAGGLEETPEPFVESEQPLSGELEAESNVDESLSELQAALLREENEPLTDEKDGLPPIDREEELPDMEDEEPDQAAYADSTGEEDESAPDGAHEYDGSDDNIEETAPHPRKKLLLDPAGDDSRGPSFEEGPEDLSEAARSLGIDFRGSDPAEAGVDPELAKAAKELGISFRDEGDAPETPEDDVAKEAQKLGISFREADVSGKPPKPLIVKYLPMILGIAIIFFLLLLGATFSGTFIGWLKN
jgi:hypothetical protein